MPANRVVTLAALYGAGGSTIGQRIAAQLGIRFLDRAVPDSVARRAGLPTAAVDLGYDEVPSRLDQALAALGRSAPPTGASGQVERLDLEHRRLQAELERFLAEAGGSGGVVVGRGAAIVLADRPGALHVYLGGSRHGRVARVMDVEGLDREAAARTVDAHDRARRDYVREAYGVDGDDPSLYHLMVDAVSLGIDACVNLTVAASRFMTNGVALAGRT
jgi:cytidylate kinase